MSRRSPPGLAFTIYLCLTAAALLVRGIWGWAALWGGLAGALIVAQRAWARTRSRESLVATCVLLAVAMNVSFQAMRYAVPAVRMWRADALLLSLDRSWFGETPALILQRYAMPGATELLSAAYMSFVPLLAFNLVRYLFWQKDRLEPFYRGLFAVYGVGFIGYFLLPAAGPYLAYPELFQAPIDGGFFTQANALLVLSGSNRVDVWPSLHIAVSAFILGFTARYSKREFALLLLPVGLLCFSIFYLRYHYAVDCIAGLALAAAALYGGRSSTKEEFSNAARLV